MDKSNSKTAGHKVASRDEWIKARKTLLEEEKELTRRSDEIAKHRQELPWVKIDKEYKFETDAGNVSLKDLFKGRSQILIYHFMLGPDYAAGCPSCSSIADSFNGVVTHLANHDVMIWAISRAPMGKLQAFKKKAKAKGTQVGYEAKSTGFLDYIVNNLGIIYKTKVKSLVFQTTLSLSKNGIPLSGVQVTARISKKPFKTLGVTTTDASEVASFKIKLKDVKKTANIEFVAATEGNDLYPIVGKISRGK